ncbi:putative type VI secretion system effector [Acinetobacter sp. ESBL14]|uniref:putative type VI secretion system effector n=1 Tax=Acinetobacter sp. ESBL14 TaxID=3077329 RepID=UPI002FCAB20F
MASMNKTQLAIDILTEQLFIVEGVITDLLTRVNMQNLNSGLQSGTNAIAVSSALVGQIGSAALASFAASDEGLDVQDFAFELTDNNGSKHYFKGCFPEVVFKKGDKVQVVAKHIDNNYSCAIAVIDIQNNYIWTGQEVVKGRWRYRVFGIKIIGVIGCLSLIFGVVAISLLGGFNLLLENYMLITLFCSFLIFIFIGWQVGGSFDGQSIELEAILKKIGFHEPSRMDLQNFALTDLEWKNKKDDVEHERWKDFTYRLDLARQADESKHGKK